MISNRKFYVEFQRRWKNQKNGRPQGSKLSPILFNAYTNDQPIGFKARSFIYADDKTITCQSQDIKVIERSLKETLSSLFEYDK